MSVAQIDPIGYGATQIAVGLSQVIKVSFGTGSNQWGGQLKIQAGGSSGTLEIVPVQLSGASTGTGNAWGKGYPLGATEVVPFNGPAVFYLAASGVTMTASFLFGLTAGATLL